MLKKVLRNQELVFTGSTVIVSAMNYLYNLVLGRMLGPQLFADIALLITMLLMLSFFATTFQLVSTKFCASLEEESLVSFKNYWLKSALVLGSVLGIIFVILAPWLKTLLNTSNTTIFIIFGCGIPFYLVLSVNRGFYQGSHQFTKLAITYQSEVWIKFIFSVLLILFSGITSSIAVQIAIFFSLIVALFPFQMSGDIKWNVYVSKDIKKMIFKFFILTLMYEFTQIIINNSDIILVKMYYDNTSSGYYAALALIGRVIYFTTWILVMMLMPKVITLEKNGQKSQHIFFKYYIMIALFGCVMVTLCYLFPEIIVQLMFGKEYGFIAPLLWLYALATALFAMSNINVYYFLSIDKYFPTFVALFMGCFQVLLITLNHNSLIEVVKMQVYSMVILLILLIGYSVYYFYKKEKIAYSKNDLKINNV